MGESGDIYISDEVRIDQDTNLQVNHTIRNVDYAWRALS